MIKLESFHISYYVKVPQTIVHTCLKAALWYDEITWQSSDIEHLATYLRKSSMLLWLAWKASTFAPAQWAKHTSFPNEMPLALTVSSGSQQSSIDSSNHLQGPAEFRTMDSKHYDYDWFTINYSRWVIKLVIAVNCTFPFPTRINGKSIEDHGQASKAAKSGLGLCLEIGNQFKKAFHGSILNGFNKKLLHTINQKMWVKSKIHIINYQAIIINNLIIKLKM